MIRNVLTGRPLRSVAAVAVLAGTVGVGALGGTPSGAAPVTKTLTGSCGGADDASKGLLAAFGGTLTVPFEVTSDVPPTLQPGESGSPISFTWKVSLDTKVVDTAANVDPVLDISNLILDMGVTGSTSTEVVEGRPGPIALTLTPGQPAVIQQGPFSGTLEDVEGGVIRYIPKPVTFTIGIDVAGERKNVNVSCQASGTAATTTVKIPGSPDIQQPIALDAQPGQTVSVDVLGQFVTPGTVGDRTIPVDPASLKVLEGPATVQGGSLSITAGAAGSTTSAVFEVCATEPEPGSDEVQRLVIDPSNDAMRRTVGFTLKYGDAETDPIWLARKWKEFPEEGGNLFGNLFNAIYLGEAAKFHPELAGQPYPAVYPKPVDWRGESFGFFFTDRFAPSVEQIDGAIESLPGIGAGGVEVRAVDGEPFSFDVVFNGAETAQRDVEQLALGSAYTILPRETLELILEEAQGLLNGGGGEEPTIPDGLTLEEYANQLRDELNAALAAGDLATAQAKFAELVAILPDLLLSNIDTDAVISFITGLFPSPPSVATTTAGEAPTPRCSQGIVDVNVAAAVAAATTVPPGSSSGGATVQGRISFAG
jgi:hypothetical protein